MNWSVAMRRGTLGLGLLAAVAACQAGDQTRPQDNGPSYVISDGNHSNGANLDNPDFFWLPPMVKDPSKTKNFDVGKFNPDLLPVITICELEGTQESQITFNQTCKAGGYSATSPSTAIPAPIVNLTSEFYQTSWTVPTSNTVFYRIK